MNLQYRIVVHFGRIKKIGRGWRCNDTLRPSVPRRIQAHDRHVQNVQMVDKSKFCAHNRLNNDFKMNDHGREECKYSAHQPHRDRDHNQSTNNKSNGKQKGSFCENASFHPTQHSQINLAIFQFQFIPTHNPALYDWCNESVHCISFRARHKSIIRSPPIISKNPSMQSVTDTVNAIGIYHRW